MTKNENGVYINCSTLEMPVKIPKGWNHYKEGITLEYGKCNDKWGYGISLQVSNGGFCSSLNDNDLIYATKNEMLFAAKNEIIEICNKFFGGKLIFKTGHLDYLFDRILDKFTIECTFQDSEKCFTYVETRNIEEIFKHAESFFSRPVAKFSFIGEEKIYTNPNSKKKTVYRQGELF